MTSTAAAVFITVPKYVAITPSPASPASSASSSAAAALGRIRPLLSVAAPASPASSSGYASSGGGCGADEGAPKGKKRRLDHLTWEEKIQRKKLKNRVAAQTSRDRKKARMEEMEGEIDVLTERTEILQNKCESLQTINDALLEKNRKLDMEVEIMRQQLTELQQQQQQQQNALSSNQQQQQQQQKVATCAGCESILNGSAVSNTDPLQQGSTQTDSQSTRAQQKQQQQQLKRTTTLATLWRIVAICLLYKTCNSSCKMPSSMSAKKAASMMSTKTHCSSMRANWRSSLKACSPISQQTWKQAIERATRLLPKMQAEQSDCLDQWWGPQQNGWNPANIVQQLQKMSA